MSVYQIKKIKGKAKKAQYYWPASLRVDGRVKNVYQGSCKKMAHEAALKKARGLKANDIS